MPEKPQPRLQIPYLGDYYDYLLKLDSAINARTRGIQAQSLLCAKLQEREAKIWERVDLLAELKGISRKEYLQILLGTDEGCDPPDGTDTEV